MREAKFRAWHIKLKEWHYYIVPDCFFRTNYINGEKAFFPHYENWSQFIGICDKNKNEIYEEDIIQFKNDNMNEPEILGFVIYDPHRNCYVFNYDLTPHYGIPVCESGDEFYLESEKIEIIGNIKENLELLNKIKN